MALFCWVLLLYLVIINCQGVFPTEIQMDRIELLNETYVDGYYNLSEFRITKFNRTAYVLNAQVELFVDINTNIKVEVSFHYNRLNNNQYTKSPMGIPKGYLCSVAEKFYRKSLMVALKDCSNLPQRQPNEPICPMEKVIRIFVVKLKFVQAYSELSIFISFSFNVGQLLGEKLFG